MATVGEIEKRKGKGVMIPTEEPMENGKSIYICTADHFSKRRRYVVFRIKLSDLLEGQGERCFLLELVTQLESAPMGDSLDVVTRAMRVPPLYMGCGDFGSRIVFGGGCPTSSSRVDTFLFSNEVYEYEMDSTIDPNPTIIVSMSRNVNYDTSDDSEDDTADHTANRKANPKIIDFHFGKLEPIMFEFQGYLFALSQCCQSNAFEAWDPDKKFWWLLSNPPMLEPADSKPQFSSYLSYLLVDDSLWVTRRVDGTEPAPVYKFQLPNWRHVPLSERTLGFPLSETLWQPIGGINSTTLGKGMALFKRLSESEGLIVSFSWNPAASNWEIQLHRLNPDVGQYRARVWGPAAHVVWRYPPDEMVGDEFSHHITHSFLDLEDNKICCVIGTFDPKVVEEVEEVVRPKYQPSWTLFQSSSAEPQTTKEVGELRIRLITFEISGEPLPYKPMTSKIVDSQVFTPAWSSNSARVLDASVLHTFVR